jgi:pyruvate/2-oxoacid:ferredoxin oxidoreductase alpha subunit
MIDWQPIETAPDDGTIFLVMMGSLPAVMAIVDRDQPDEIAHRGFWPFRKKVVTPRDPVKVWVMVYDMGGGTQASMFFRSGADITHWAPIPNLPD